MKNSEIKNIAIKEILRSIESAYVGLEKYEDFTEKEMEKANEIVCQAQHLLIKKYVGNASKN